MVEGAHGIARVHVRAWQLAYRGLLSDDDLDGLSVEARTKGWAALLGQSDATGFTLVAEDRADDVVGFCSVVGPASDDDLGQRACEVTAIYVDPGRWGSGVGAALLDAAIGRLDDRWDEATLWVFEDNRRARSFYAKQGFAPDGSLRRDGDDDPPEVRLRRSLLSAAAERRAGR